MATMGCKQFLEQLDSWVDGERQSDARAHLAGCSNCRGMVEDLDAITKAAHSMAGEMAEPPAYLWNSIRTQLEHEGIIRDARAGETTASAGFWHGWFAFPRAALAGVCLLVLLAASFWMRGPLTRRMNDYRWIQGTQNSTNPLGAQLDSVEHATLASVASNPAVAATLHQNLAIVDNYISLCEKSVRENPQSEMTRDFLYDAYQQKASLLAQMNERGE